MAISKVILNGVTQMDVTQDTVTADKLLQSYTATKNDGTKISGMYEPPVINTQSKSVMPSETAQTILPDAGYYLSQVNVNAIPSSYIIPSGTLSISSNGTYDVASYESAEVNAGSDFENEIIMRTISGTYENGIVSFVGSYAFHYCSSLMSINFPFCEIISSNAFNGCRSLANISFPACTNIGSYAFFDCRSLTDVYFPVCENIGGSAFAACSKLTNVNFPSCLVINNEAFNGCYSLANISFPACTNIGTNAFRSCWNGLTDVVFPVCANISATAFQTCSILSSISFPACANIGSGAFSGCYMLAAAIFPSALTVYSNAFNGCYSLANISFPACTNISSYAFRSCRGLLSAYFLGSSVPTLSAYAFLSTPIAGYTTYTDGVLGSIFVRESMLTAFQTATNWSPYSERMVGLTDAEIEALST